MSIVYANIGSNLGDKEALIEKALERIGQIFGYYCRSGCVESEPWGFESTHRFLNIGVAFKSELAPEEILHVLQGIEKDISSVNHRDALGRYADREIDIDIMAIDEMEYHSEVLCVPHRHLLQRDFFIIPLMELAPGWRHPGL